MNRTDGEHELVLGNKQLLSAFFVVVILLGVFFTMGYFVGKNTATAGFNGGQAVAGGTRPDAAGRPLDSGSQPASAAPPDSTSAAVDPNNFTPPAERSQAAASSSQETRSEAKSAPPASSGNEFLPKTETARTESVKTETVVQPSSEEMYLQVSAVRRPDAENMVKLLRERGFAALLGESSKQGLFRVLVGPFKTRTDMAHAKTDLKAKGFESIVAK